MLLTVMMVMTMVVTVGLMVGLMVVTVMVTMVMTVMVAPVRNCRQAAQSTWNISTSKCCSVNSVSLVTLTALIELFPFFLVIYLF